MKEQLVERIQQLRNEIDKSAAQHNALLGQFGEATHILKLLAESELHNEAKAEYEDPIPDTTPAQ